MVTFFKNGAAERESACAEKNPFLFSFPLNIILLLTLCFTNSSNLHLSIQSDNNIIYTEYWVQGKKNQKGRALIFYECTGCESNGIKQNVGIIKQADKGQNTTVKDLKCWRFEHLWPFAICSDEGLIC